MINKINKESLSIWDAYLFLESGSTNKIQWSDIENKISLSFLNVVASSHVRTISKVPTQSAYTDTLADESNCFWGDIKDFIFKKEFNKDAFSINQKIILRIIWTRYFELLINKQFNI